MSRKRPFGVTLLLWMVLSLTVWGLLRLYASLRWRDVLGEFHASLSPLYLSITGAGWTVAGSMLLWGVWAARRWTHRVIPISIGLWLVEYWIERLFFQASRANLPFMIVITALLSIITLTLSFHPKTKDFLLRNEEHEQPEAHPISK